MPAPGPHNLRNGRSGDVLEAILTMSAVGPRPVRTVFLDRDGTINVKAAAGGYVTSPADLILLPGAAKAVAALNKAGLRTVLVTNQRWLSGPCTDHMRLAFAIAASPVPACSSERLESTGSICGRRS